MQILPNFIAILNRASLQRQVSSLSFYNNLVLKCLDVLVKLGYIRGFTILSKKYVRIFLKFDASGEGVIRRICIVSKPGNRIYTGFYQLRKEKFRNVSTLFLSTPEGLKTSSEAIISRVGGEILFRIN